MKLGEHVGGPVVVPEQAGQVEYGLRADRVYVERVAQDVEDCQKKSCIKTELK